VRIVSLVPSVTETLLAWDVQPIACTRFCEQPSLPTVGGTKDPEIDAIVALAPDLVVMNDEENRREDADALIAAGIPVHATVIRSVADVGGELARLASRLGVPWLAPVLPGPASGPRRRAFIPIWRRPWMTLGADTYGSSMLAHAGVDNVCALLGSRYAEIELDEVRALGPDLVVAPSQPYPFAERHRSELASVAPVVFVDGRDLFWWGIRTPQALERLRAALSALTA
jgi:ABC-type Fe3+-hydroxamate transport system substrate-binding protein